MGEIAPAVSIAKIHNFMRIPHRLEVRCAALTRPSAASWRPQLMTRSCPTAGSLISSLATLNEIPYGKRRELPLVGIRRYGDYCGECLGSIISVSSFSSDALYLNQGRC